MSDRNTTPAVVYFDGFCNLCNGTVDFLIRRDRHRRLRYASLQSPRGQRECGATPDGEDPGSVVLSYQGRLYYRSTAVLCAVALLGGPWRLVSVLRVVPPPIRDAVYRFVAARRYSWFGRRDACRVPTAEERDRFLED
jgi:predicted DCC family thiol-disulfide oxidoreductase YuxK